jgi:hypothetical protein
MTILETKDLSFPDFPYNDATFTSLQFYIMQSSSKKLNAYTVELTIKESSKEFDKARIEVLENIRTHATIK